MHPDQTNPSSKRDRLTMLAREGRLEEPAYVMRPSLPSLSEFQTEVETIWGNQVLTNRGEYHAQFESALSAYMQIDHVSLTSNGTLAILVALRALNLEPGEIITTPFTFPATVHAIEWSGHTPVFCDIDPDFMNLDPLKLEALIGDQTRAIMPVHVFGAVCDVAAIGEISDRHGLPVLYDSAHAFGVTLDDQSIGNFGDLNVFSFHATKTLSSIEGGAVVTSSPEMKEHIDLLCNFGIQDKEAVLFPGINAKMNELQAAFGTLHLKDFDERTQKRKALVNQYHEHLEGIPGITLQREQPGVVSNYGYAPIRIEETSFGINRDELYDVLLEANVHPRKYFFPLCSHCNPYNSLPSADPALLPNAESASNQILCLPLYADLDSSTVEFIIDLIRRIHQNSQD